MKRRVLPYAARLPCAAAPPSTAVLSRAAVVSFTAVSFSALFLLQCNTYTPDLLVAEPVTVEPEPMPDADDDLPGTLPVDPTAPDSTDCPTPPCEPTPEPQGPDEPEPSNPVAPVVPTMPMGPDPVMTGPDVPGVGGNPPTGTGGTGGTSEPNGGAPPVATGGSGSTGGSPPGGGGSTPEPDMEVGGGGSGPVIVVPDPVSPTLIENFEDGNNRLLDNQDRTGYWYTAGSEEGTITPAPMEFETAALDTPNPGLEDSEQALHFVLSDFLGDETSWAVVGVALNEGDPYADAANYAGLVLWARSAGDSATIAVRLPTTSTDADDDHFGIELDLTSEWQAYWVPFDGLAQQGFGEEQTFDAAELLEIQFALVPLETELDVWIDDIEFRETAP